MRIIVGFLLSARGVSAIDNERVTDHEACARAAKPENGRGDLLWLTEPPNRLVSQDFLHGVWFLRQHVRNHRRVDRAGAHGVIRESGKRQAVLFVTRLATGT